MLVISSCLTHISVTNSRCSSFRGDLQWIVNKPSNISNTIQFNVQKKQRGSDLNAARSGGRLDVRFVRGLVSSPRARRSGVDFALPLVLLPVVLPTVDQGGRAGVSLPPATCLDMRPPSSRGSDAPVFPWIVSELLLHARGRIGLALPRGSG